MGQVCASGAAKLRYGGISTVINGTPRRCACWWTRSMRTPCMLTRWCSALSVVRRRSRALAKREADADARGEAGVNDRHSRVEADHGVADEHRHKGNEEGEAFAIDHRAGEESRGANGCEVEWMRDEAGDDGEDDER